MTPPPDSAPAHRPGPAPVVRLPASGLSIGAIVAIFAVAGVLLFVALERRQRGGSAPQIRAPADAAASSAPSPLRLGFPPPAAIGPPAPALPPLIRPLSVPPRIVYLPSTPSEPVRPPPPERVAAEPVLTFDGPNGDAAPTPGGEAAGPAAGGNPAAQTAAGGLLGRPSRPSAIRNLGSSVLQGTIIPAVLETALDSTRPGLARAIVARDTRGFDGRRVLIPRGSRLIGEYQSQAVPGQKRALVNWIRLIRPDGVAIELSSPGGDALGRAGIAGSVDSHFLERFGGALLQSALSIGVNVATAKVTDVPLILGSPGTLGIPATAGGAQGGGQAVAPTIRVRQGTPISIFVARDLDFRGFEGQK